MIRAIRLGNCNNDLIDGPATLNLNNEASNANWNNGVGVILLLDSERVSSCQCPPFRLHLWRLKYR
uniref:Uncharacterized protein n=1 Tax=Siphoviridae sp. ctJT77 TaxID=2825432 RepID=A0A8S5UZT8_9CAUD|nr:MAG TPA: hypothetical protein [Siphoviridae sp. ctJT77]